MIRSKSFKKENIATTLEKSSYGVQLLNKIRRETIHEKVFGGGSKGSKERQTTMTLSSSAKNLGHRSYGGTNSGKEIESTLN